MGHVLRVRVGLVLLVTMLLVDQGTEILKGILKMKKNHLFLRLLGNNVRVGR